MEQVTTLGIDLAKRVFALHGVDGNGRTVVRRIVRREELVMALRSLSPCLIGMEACTGARAWARQFMALGHTVRLMAPKFVLPYRKSGKNDGNDAEAICVAVLRPNMRFVPVKSEEQEALLALHRVRQGSIEERTATLNRMRALLAEFGIALPNRAPHVRRDALSASEALPHFARQALYDLREHLRTLDERISAYDRELEAQAKASEPARRLMQIRGIGPLTAVAIVATVGCARNLVSGRQFAAWLGLVPRQHSSGGRNRLGRITCRGDAYLCCLLVQGARSVLHTAMRHHGSPLTLGALAAGAPRLSYGARGDRRQERAHRLGAAQQRAGVSYCLGATSRNETAHVDGKQVRPAFGYSNQLGGGNTVPTNVWEPNARLSSGSR